MKAILIDPARREISGIEIDPTRIKEAFSGEAGLLTATIGKNRILYYDIGAYKRQERAFSIQGTSQIFRGKALLFGRLKSQWPLAPTLTAREAECLVTFSS